MKVMKLSEVDYAPSDRVFRASVPRQTGFAALFIAIVICLVAWRVYAGFPLILLVPSVAGLTLGALMAGSAALKATRSTNWLLICGEKRVMIKFRSYLNTCFPQNDLQAVCLDTSEIKFARQAAFTLKVSSKTEGVAQETSVFLDLAVDCDLSKLRHCLEHEHELGRTQSTVWQDYPVSVMPDNVIRIEWKSPRTRISPKISVALQALGDSSVIDESINESLDLTGRQALSKAEMDSQILALASKGRKMDAIRVARTAYGYSAREALDFVDGLSNDL